MYQCGRCDSIEIMASYHAVTTRNQGALGYMYQNGIESEEDDPFYLKCDDCGYNTHDPDSWFVAE
jgi:hypothetical protein